MSPRGGAKPPRTRAFPPSLAGGCLRNATMELMGFGRLLDADTRARMAQGTQWHQAFQEDLARSGELQAKEARVADPARGISGRMDAVLVGPAGPIVVEYKTVSQDRFEEIVREGEPPVSFWAQLHVYLALTRYPEGRLVVDARVEPRRRLVFYTGQDPEWSAWVLDRIGQARAYADERRLPEREVGVHCVHCDRWQRCFRSEEERDRAVADHPAWTPSPLWPRRDVTTREEVF